MGSAARVRSRFGVEQVVDVAAEGRGVDPWQVAPVLERRGAAAARGPDGGELGYRAADARHHDAHAGGDTVEDVAAVIAGVAT